MDDTLKLVLTSAVVSSIVSTVIGYIVSLRLKKTEYQYEYKKYILEKRKLAYESLEKVLVQMRRKTKIAGRPYNLYRILYATKDTPTADEFRKMLSEVNYNGYWFTDEMYKELKKVHKTLNEIWRKYKEAGVSPKQMDMIRKKIELCESKTHKESFDRQINLAVQQRFDIAYEYKRQFFDFNNELKRIYFKDIHNLSDTENFIHIDFDYEE